MFEDKFHEELRRYILEKKGVDIGSNMNWNKTVMWILIGLAIIVGGIGVWKLLRQ